MKVAQGMIGRVLVARFDKGEELLESIKKVCKEVGIKHGIVYGVGGLSKVRLSVGSVDGESKVIEIDTKEKITNVSTLIGIISTLGDEVHLHVHLTLSQPNGTIISGCVLPGNLVNPSLEVVILEIQKAKLKRVIKEGYELLEPHE